MGKHQEQKDVRRYLLDRLSESKKQDFEYRLLRDDGLAEELEFAEDELIDEYLANELSPDDRTRFEKIFLAHPDRQRRLNEGRIFKRHFDELPVPTPRPSPNKLDAVRNWLNKFFLASPVGAVVSVLAVTVIGGLVWRSMSRNSDLEDGLVALNKAYATERPVEARISNLQHAPFISPRGKNRTAVVNETEQRRAQRLLSDADDERKDAASAQAMGQLYLTQKETDKAIEYLERARQADPNNARIYSDLGAAYLEKGKPYADSDNPNASQDDKGIQSFGRSVENLKRALELDPNLLEALFNLALVHEYQGLDNDAISDWRAYLQKDSSSPWAVDAQEKLRDLENRTKARSETDSKPIDVFMNAYRARDDTAAWDIYVRKHAASGNEITNSLVDRFLSESASQPSENLRALTYLGQLEFSKTQDVYTSDLARFYSTATPQTRSLLLQTRQSMAKGYELVVTSHVGKANELFRAARATFEKEGNGPETLLAENALVHAAAIQADATTGEELLARLIPVLESKGYKWLLAQTLSEQGHIQSNRSNYSQAISDGNRALQLFRESNDASSSTFETLVQLAMYHLFLNDVETSCSYLSRAQTIAKHGEARPTKMWMMLITISFNLTVLKLYRAALDYQNEALQIVPDVPLLRSLAYQYTGRSYASLKRFDLAVANIKVGYEVGKALSGISGKKMMASASLYLGDVYRAAGDPGTALTAYEESANLYEAIGFYHYEYASHKGKFLAYRAQNNDAMAEREMRIVIDLYNEYRKKILDARQEAFFFDREQDTYDLAIDFTYSRLNDTFGAFDYSEACRARNLRELMEKGAEMIQSDSGLDLRAKASRGKETQPLTVTGVKENLNERVQLVQFAVLQDKVLVWHITRSAIFSTPIPVESAKLNDLITIVLEQIRKRDQDGANKNLKALYDLLIEPIRQKLDPNLVLCIVPDKMLHYLPFAALLSHENHFLAQDFQLIVSPSATFLIESTTNAVKRPPLQKEQLLAVGDPAFDRKANPNLEHLPAAQREVKQIAEHYHLPNVLITQRATRKSIMTDLPKVDVAHFAAHYEIDPRSNLLSQLLLAPEAGERSHAQPSGLRAYDIYGMNLRRLRLVVLAGCETGIEQQFGGEGPIGFARSFLVAGVPVVVASLWPVDSDATSQLMENFHMYRKQELKSTAEALMLAQKDMMKGNYRDPYFWAGFVVVGGYSNF